MESDSEPDTTGATNETVDYNMGLAPTQAYVDPDLVATQAYADQDMAPTQAYVDPDMTATQAYADDAMEEVEAHPEQKKERAEPGEASGGMDDATQAYADDSMEEKEALSKQREGAEPGEALADMDDATQAYADETMEDGDITAEEDGGEDMAATQAYSTDSPAAETVAMDTSGVEETQAFEDEDLEADGKDSSDSGHAFCIPSGLPPKSKRRAIEEIPATQAFGEDGKPMIKTSGSENPALVNDGNGEDEDGCMPTQAYGDVELGDQTTQEFEDVKNTSESLIDKNSNISEFDEPTQAFGDDEDRDVSAVISSTPEENGKARLSFESSPVARVSQEQPEEDGTQAFSDEDAMMPTLACSTPPSRSRRRQTQSDTESDSDLPTLAVASPDAKRIQRRPAGVDDATQAFDEAETTLKVKESPKRTAGTNKPTLKRVSPPIDEPEPTQAFEDADATVGVIESPQKKDTNSKPALKRVSPPIDEPETTQAFEDADATFGEIVSPLKKNISSKPTLKRVSPPIDEPESTQAFEDADATVGGIESPQKKDTNSKPTLKRVSPPVDQPEPTQAFEDADATIGVIESPQKKDTNSKPTLKRVSPPIDEPEPTQAYSSLDEDADGVSTQAFSNGDRLTKNGRTLDEHVKDGRPVLKRASPPLESAAGALKEGDPQSSDTVCPPALAVEDHGPEEVTGSAVESQEDIFAETQDFCGEDPPEAAATDQAEDADDATQAFEEDQDHPAVPEEDSNQTLENESLDVPDRRSARQKKITEKEDSNAEEATQAFEESDVEDNEKTLSTVLKQTSGRGKRSTNLPSTEGQLLTPAVGTSEPRSRAGRGKRKDDTKANVLSSEPEEPEATQAYAEEETHGGGEESTKAHREEEETQAYGMEDDGADNEATQAYCAEEDGAEEEATQAYGEEDMDVDNEVSFYFLMFGWQY